MNESILAVFNDFSFGSVSPCALATTDAEQRTTTNAKIDIRFINLLYKNHVRPTLKPPLTFCFGALMIGMTIPSMAIANDSLPKRC